LLCDDVPVPLMPKVFDVLALLVERSGHLVEKNELLNTVWADTFVEETNITRIIYELRKVLGEDKNGNKYIETVAKKGYRFVAEVEEIRESPAPKPGNGNGKSSFAANELPALEFAGTADVSDLPIPQTNDENRLISKPKQKTRLVLRNRDCRFFDNKTRRDERSDRPSARGDAPIRGHQSRPDCRRA
jgi:DNA-binding winged helix-turn-helix (wHTH) protein